MHRKVGVVCAAALFLLYGCEGGKTAALSAPLGGPAYALNGAGGGRGGIGHLGTGFGLYFPDDRRADNSWFADVNFNVNLTPNLSVEAAMGYIIFNVVEVPRLDGKMVSIPLSVAAQYGDSFGNGRWYGGLGLGWALNDFNQAGVNAGDSFYFHMMGGVDLPIRDWISVNVELRYMVADAALSGSVTDTLDLDAFMLRANVVYMF